MIEQNDTNNSFNKRSGTKIRRVVFVVFSLCWMMLIFYMSSRSADESTQDSNFVGMKLGAILHPDFEQWSKEEQIVYAQKVDHAVRKTAHAVEYAILGAFLAGAFFIEAGRGYQVISRCVYPAYATATVYAISDEIHQIFVPGRACQLWDVCIDSGGALVGACAGCALLVMFGNHFLHRTLKNYS